jgi:MEMO1 family protein
MGAIRAPAVAGTFYPAHADRLRAAIEGYLAASGARTMPMPKAVIAPHAGYVYAGPVAGHAFGSLREEAPRISRVVVIGPAHFVPIRGLALPGADAFRTPLGDVPLDGDATGAIADLPQVQVADGPHHPEHALEVEIPFLQTVLGDSARALGGRRCDAGGGRAGAGAALGRTGDAHRDQLRSVALRAVRGRAGARRRDRGHDRAP